MRLPNLRSGMAIIGTATRATSVMRQSNQMAAANAAPPFVACATVLPVSATRPRCSSTLSRVVRLTNSEAPRRSTTASGRFTECLKTSWRISETTRTQRVSDRYWWLKFAAAPSSVIAIRAAKTSSTPWNASVGSRDTTSAGTHGACCSTHCPSVMFLRSRNSSTGESATSPAPSPPADTSARDMAAANCPLCFRSRFANCQNGLNAITGGYSMALAPARRGQARVNRSMTSQKAG